MSGNCIHWYEYNIWANERVMNHLKSLPVDTFTQKVDLGFHSIADVISHLVSTDEVWFSRIKEKRVAVASSTSMQFSNLDEASDCMDKLQTQISEYLSLMDVEKVVTYRDARGQEYQNSIAEIIQQVVNHGTYHRGNITTILRFLGYPGVLTDYIAYLRK